MRIVHLVPAMEEGGVESVVLSLSRALICAGNESVVLSRGGRLVAQLEKAGARHLALDLKSKNVFTYFFRAAQLRQILVQIKPDLVCVHSRVPAWLFVWANRVLRLPWISYAHGANSVSRYSAVMTYGSRVVVPSKFLKDYLISSYGQSIAEKIRIVPNAVDLKKFDPENLDHAYMEEKRREWMLKAGERVTMSIGRITALKGFDAVIRDFANCASGKLVIVGGADQDKQGLLENLKSLARDLGVADRVIFAGRESRIPECLALADEVVSGNTTKPESFGLSVAEAYAMNRPVRVLRRFGGVAEIMDAVAALKKKTYREAITELYNFDIMLSKTLQIYKELVK